MGNDFNRVPYEELIFGDVQYIKIGMYILYVSL